MVKLSYSFRLKAPFQEVWNYFSNFENIKEYDPCVKSATLIEKGNNFLGRKFDITTVHNGKQGKMIYEVKKYSQLNQSSLKNFRIQLYGFNQRLQSTDVITVKQIANSSQNFNLMMEYQAELSFRGIFWLANIFASGVFKKIALNAQEGARKKCIQNWGQENIKVNSKQ